MKQAYLVYPGLGKTTLAKKNASIADIETKIFKDASLAKYIGTKDYPNYRGATVVEKNPEWPNNLYEYARRELASGKILVSVPKQDSYDMLNALGIKDYAFIMPDAERLEQLRQDYIARGDDEEYIKRNLTERYKEVLNYARALGKEIIFIKQGEYLIDIFDGKINKANFPITTKGITFANRQKIFNYVVANFSAYYSKIEISCLIFVSFRRTPESRLDPVFQRDDSGKNIRQLNQK